MYVFKLLLINTLEILNISLDHFFCFFELIHPLIKKEDEIINDVAKKIRP